MQKHNLPQRAGSGILLDIKYPFWPERVYFEPEALKYPRGEDLFELFQGKAVPLKMTRSHNRLTGLPGQSAREGFEAAGYPAGFIVAPILPPQSSVYSRKR